MCLLGNGTVGHSAGLEPFHNGFDAFHFLDRDAVFRIVELHQTSQIPGFLLVNLPGIFLKHLVIILPYRLLKQVDRLRIVPVMFSLASKTVASDALQCQVRIQPQRIKCLTVEPFHIFFDFLHGDASHPADGMGKIFVDHFFGDSHSLKNLGSLIRLDCGNSHLGSDLDNSIQNCLIVIVNCRIIIFFQKSVFNHLPYGLMRQIRVHRACAVSEKRRKMMDFSWLCRLQNDRHGRTLFRPHEIMVHCRNRQKRRNRHMVFVHAPVCQNQDCSPVLIGTVHFNKKTVQRLFHRHVLKTDDGNFRRAESRFFHVLDLQKIRVGKNRIVDFQNLTVFRLLF